MTEGQTMGMKTLLAVPVLVLAIGGLLVAAPSVGHADPITIHNVSVTVGDITYCGRDSTAPASTCNATPSTTNRPIWGIGTLFGGGITLLAGQSLILTQVGGFNFDSSEGNATGASNCFGVGDCLTNLTINGTTVGPTANLTLANDNLDDGTAAHNEA